MKRYLAFDIGCIECGESSSVIGIYYTEDEADTAAQEARIEQRANWTGQHSIEVFEIEVPE